MSRLMIRKVSDVLNLFSLECPEWGVSEVSRLLELPKSTTSELMASMADEELLSAAGRGRYRLGWRLFELGQTLLDTTKFRIEARRVMQDLVQTWGETSHLAVLVGIEAVYLEKIQPSPAVKISLSRTGVRLPAYCSGVGKVLLAHKDWDDVKVQLQEEGMPALTTNTISSIGELAEELRLVRERDYAYEAEEICLGLCCVASPIRDHTGSVVAAISLSVPACRFHNREEELTSAVVDAALRVSDAAATDSYGTEGFSLYNRKGIQRA